MEKKVDIKVFNDMGNEGIDGLTKSAIIYRDDSARFIYVCFHCGCMFTDINSTLQHIESHFQLANVVVDQVDQPIVNGSEMNDNLSMIPSHGNFDIKTELPDYTDEMPLTMTVVPIIQTMFGEDYNEKPVSRKQKDIRKARKPKKVEESSAVEHNRRNDHIQNPFRCHTCSKVCKNASSLRGHLNTHTNAELLRINRCTKCDQYFKSASALRSHILKVHIQTEEGTQYRKDDFIRYEERESFTEEQHSCQMCTQKFYIKSNLDMHLKTIHHSGQRRLQCPTCSSVFTAPKNYYAHQLEHKRVGSNITEFNETAALASIDALIDERVVYGEDGSYRCLMCDATAEAQYEIRCHVRKKHVYSMFPPPMEPKKEFICDLCGTMLKSKHALLKHFLIHTNTKSHACKFCGKLFRIASTTKIHERQHTGEKPYQCHECGKAFISKGLLTAHKKSHEDTTYPCEVCGKVFRLPSGYRKHVKTHRLERSFKCTICEKTFNTKIYLYRHMEIHSGRKHKCHYCDSTFNTGDGRRQHQRHAHKYEMGLPL